MNAPRHRLGLCELITIWSAWIGAPGGARAQDATTIALQSVVKVIASGCSGQHPARQSSGFAYYRQGVVVTAYHAIAGCGSVAVKVGTTGVSYAATVDRTLSRADLAMLAVTGISLPPLQAGIPTGHLGETVEALGFNLDAQSPTNIPLTYKIGKNTLTEVLPPQLSAEINSVGIPDANMTIVYLAGQLLPGSSGSPVVDSEGNVVAIADGGLEHGAAGESFAIPSSQLATLIQSSQKATQVPSGMEGLFAADIDVDLGNSAVACGAEDFRRVRQRPIGALVASTDDPLGLNQLLTAFGLGPQNSVLFDVYQSITSGAAIVLPAGAVVTKLPNALGTCAVAEPGGVELRFQTTDSTSMPAVDSTVRAFEQSIMPTFATEWYFDPSMFHPPTSRQDGLIVLRKGFAHYPLGGPVPPMPPAEYVFEVVAFKNNKLVIAAVISHRNGQFQACHLNPSMQGCGGVLSAVGPSWEQGVLAIHLTTFPFTSP